MEKESLIKRINESINDDSLRDEEVFNFDNDIDIVVEEYKTRENDGYCITLQTIKVKDYTINCHHDNGKKLVEECEMLRASIDKIGIDKTIERYTNGDSWNERMREWKR